MEDGIIRLSLTPAEGLLIGLMLDAAIEQYEAASFEERNDEDIKRAHSIWLNVRRYLPSLEAPHAEG